MNLLKRVHRCSTRNLFLKNHEGIVSDFLPWLLIAIAILVILMITVFILKGSGFSLIDKIKAIIGGV
ncbi:MAG: hypothetical protein KGH55_00065 [Nanoarchaeota archaeon]|nr:hypothetical protein [Nanoarchaeota archaeon]